jgi:hypothetical protein
MAHASTTLAAGDASNEQFVQQGGSIKWEVKKMTQYNTAHTRTVAEVLEMLDSSPRGLTFEKAVAKRDMRSRNGGGGEIPQPHDMPGWLCCMAPYLLMTEEMEQYFASVAKQATVLRQGYSMDKLLVDASVSVARLCVPYMRMHMHMHIQLPALIPNPPPHTRTPARVTWRHCSAGCGRPSPRRSSNRKRGR